MENELGRLKAITDPSEEDLARIQQIEKAELPAVQGTIDDLEGAETTLQKDLTRFIFKYYNLLTIPDFKSTLKKEISFLKF